VEDAGSRQLAEAIRRVHAGLRVVDPSLAAQMLHQLTSSLLAWLRVDAADPADSVREIGPRWAGAPPEPAYDYIVNGKSAIEWVMERQAVTTDKKSGITNDANDWAANTIHNPRYPLELLLRVITVSLETQKIVRALPKLDIV